MGAETGEAASDEADTTTLAEGANETSETEGMARRSLSTDKDESDDDDTATSTTNKDCAMI